MSRLRLPVVLMAAALVLGAVSDQRMSAAASHRRPNILIIVTDDQRADTLRAIPRTMRWFRAGGVSYPNAYVSTPLCCPSRASIMTGRFVHNHRVRTNEAAGELDQSSTIQRYLGRAGYRTALIGKYLNNWNLRRDPPVFDKWAMMGRGYYNRPFNVNGRLRLVRGYTTDFIRDRTARVLRAFEGGDGRPWFLYVAPFAPHKPARPAARHVGAAVPPWEPGPAVGEQNLSDKPSWVRAQNEGVRRARRTRSKQFRTLMAVDQLVDRTMSALGRLGERERTLAMFVSDNGFFWAEHRLRDKRLPYTEALKVPLFIRWPGYLQPGTSDERMVQTVDIAPTLLEAAGVTPSAAFPLDGHSLLGPDARDRILSEYFVDRFSPSIPDWASIRTDGYQYVEYYGPAGNVKESEYYDLVSDPWQLTNLLGDDDPSNDPSADRLAQVSAQLARDRRCEGTTGPSACP